MALISEPEVLFLDEPTLGLDVIARSELWDIIRSLKGKITVILTTHYMEEAELLSDRVGIMKDGVLKYVGTPKEIVTKETIKDAYNIDADIFEKTKENGEVERIVYPINTI